MPIRNSECQVYPGGFVPLHTKESINQQTEDISKKVKRAPLVNMVDYPDFLKIEVAIPGVHKEDILIEIEENILYVCVIENELNQINNNFKIHEFDSKKYERHIILPNNIDVAFANACYTDGILKLHFSKTNSPDKKQQCKLFVY